MNILSADGRTLINYDNIIGVQMREIYDQYASLDDHWEIIAIYSGGSYCILATFPSEQECKNTFQKLCDKIWSRLDITIDLEDLWDD